MPQADRKVLGGRPGSAKARFALRLLGGNRLGCRLCSGVHSVKFQNWMLLTVTGRLPVRYLTAGLDRLWVPRCACLSVERFFYSRTRIPGLPLFARALRLCVGAVVVPVLYSWGVTR